MLVSHSVPLYFAVGHPRQHLQPDPHGALLGSDPDFRVPPVAYFIETGRVPTLDPLVDALLTEWLAQDEHAQAYCSQCYAHFTPVEKLYEVQASTSCTLSFPRNNPELARQVQLPLPEYLKLFDLPAANPT
jgi:hypothetical protein